MSLHHNGLEYKKISAAPVLSSEVHKDLMFHTGTSADIMKVGGYKLSALEIESALLEVISFHPPF